jgi:hypothetical protein
MQFVKKGPNVKLCYIFQILNSLKYMNFAKYWKGSYLVSLWAYFCCYLIRFKMLPMLRLVYWDNRLAFYNAYVGIL